MSLAGLWNVPANESQLAQWSFDNAAQHADIIRVIFKNTGKQLDSYVIDPFDAASPEQMGAWLYQHQTMHQQMDAILGIAGYDLTEVNFLDQSMLGGWIQAHALEHQQAAQILGLE